MNTRNKKINETYFGLVKGINKVMDIRKMLMSIKHTLLLISVLWLWGCTPNGDDEPSNHIEALIESKISNKKINLILPTCFVQKSKRNSDLMYFGGGGGVSIQYTRLAFSDANFNTNHLCLKKDGSNLLTSITPIQPDVYDDYKRDIYQYVGFRINSSFLGNKNNADLYRTGSDQQILILNENYHKLKRPLSIEFAQYDEYPNVPFRYYFKVITIIHHEFKLEYTVVATASNPEQFAEQFRQVIENNQSILDHPEIIDKFIINNENIARYFEAHSKVFN